LTPAALLSQKRTCYAQDLLEAGTPVADLNWLRLSAWQELTAEAFDPPQRRAALKEVDRVTIDYEKGSPAQALMFLLVGESAALASLSLRTRRGDYDIKRIQFVTDDQRQVEAELAGIPTADTGEIPGDLILCA